MMRQLALANVEIELCAAGLRVVAVDYHPGLVAIDGEHLTILGLRRRSWRAQKLEVGDVSISTRGPGLLLNYNSYNAAPLVLTWDELRKLDVVTTSEVPDE